MTQKRSKKYRTYTRVQRLKRRKKKILSITLSISAIIFLIISGLLIKTKYISYRCTDLTYAIDYHFTNWKNKDLRINRVQSITFTDKNDTNVKVEAFGLSHRAPHQRITLIGELSKKPNGTWIVDTLKKKD